MHIDILIVKFYRPRRRLQRDFAALLTRTARMRIQQGSRVQCQVAVRRQQDAAAIRAGRIHRAGHVDGSGISHQAESFRLGPGRSCTGRIGLDHPIAGAQAHIAQRRESACAQYVIEVGERVAGTRQRPGIQRERTLCVFRIGRALQFTRNRHRAFGSRDIDGARIAAGCRAAHIHHGTAPDIDIAVIRDQRYAACLGIGGLPRDDLADASRRRSRTAAQCHAIGCRRTCRMQSNRA